MARRAGVVSEKYTRVIAAKISFRLPSRARQRIAIPAYTRACLIDLLGLCFCGISGKSDPERGTDAY